MKKIIGLLKKLMVFAFVGLVIFNVFNLSVYASTNLFSSVNSEYDSQILTDKELENEYARIEEKNQTQLVLEEEAERLLLNYAVEIEPGIYIFDVPYEVYETYPQEIANLVDASLDSYERYQDGELLLDDGYLIVSDQATDFITQDSPIRFVSTYTKIAFINIITGFDIIVEKGAWSIVLITVFLAIGATSLIYDILTFDTNVWARLAYTLTGTMYTVMGQIISMYEKIPSYIVSAVTLLMRSASSVVSAQVAIAITFLKFLFPPFVHSSSMLDAINAGKKVTIHYTAIFYSSFSVSL